MKLVFFGILCFVLVPISALAATISFATSPLWLSETRVPAGKSVTVSTAVMKTGDEKVTGGVTFYANEKQIGFSDFSLPAHTYGAVASVSWVPAPGAYAISAKITRAVIARDGKEEMLTTETEVRSSDVLVVLLDTDADGIPNVDDPDDDNDGVSDADEKKAGTDPLVKNSPHLSLVAGVSTSSMGDLLGGATGAAQSVGATLFDTSENARKASGNYINNKLTAIKAAPESATTTAGMLWWWGGFKLYALKILSFFLNNIYAFYIALIFIALWVIRRFWRRHSLD